MNAPRPELLRAVDLAIAGAWDAAHCIVQTYEDDATAAWIHAVIHKVEGDSSNARYWYRHANRMNHLPDDPTAELTTIRAGLIS